MQRKKIAIIGAGPGGLAAAMLLSARGYHVQLFEKQDYIGGRTSSFSKFGYTFDLGPTFFSMPYILEEIFLEAGRRLDDYVSLKKIDPMYTLMFDDFSMKASSDRQKMKQIVETHFPGYGIQYERFMLDTRKKMNVLLPILQKNHDSLFDYVRLQSIKAWPKLELSKTLYDVLSKYFDDDRLKLSFTFQSKYLGMSPWECPGLFSILAFMEHEYGIFHPVGGLNKLTEAMGIVAREHGAGIHTGTGVAKIIIGNNRTVKGLQLDNGDKIAVDHVIMNADFAQAMSQLVEDDLRRKYKTIKLEKKRYSCSTFMIYAGVDTSVPLDHHTILFSKDYKRNVEEISHLKTVSQDPSIYIQNASITDSTLAPTGKSALYILAPVPNNFSPIEWEKEKGAFYDLILSKVEEKTGLHNLRHKLETETVLTPADWENKKYVYKGATFNLAHNLRQMMYFRPHNKLTEFRGLWLVGGGTHPGSGLPTIFESARITANLLSREMDWGEGMV
ncbi:phytoene desaturase [Bacillus sp. A301a_S52]|nr:phytoene desaturase [Bacillus sp. A301a_S52]